ncbi:hypothetical protein [Schaalia sp. lx-100]|uniref:hypothetical protein n=1 Tax=Schaalia sp. lx-100 TaxID=2899081 RepID=UPI001E2D2566|nr:hypothetical protein [Schaalia sp. lx-100]MCD4557714.1 hypothetical protein [Schaalia sp. lx-100]
MKYDNLLTIQIRMDYRQAKFLLENLAAQNTNEWMEAFRAQNHIAETLGITYRKLP